MSEILDVPEVRERVMRWSVQQYERWAEGEGWPAHTELIRGVVIQNMAKSPQHRALTKRLYDLCLTQKPRDYLVFGESPLRLADSEPEPDVMVVRGAEPDFEHRHPETAALVIEVAVSNPALDRTNRSLYAEAGVAEYWIVLAREKAIEVYHDLRDGAYQATRVYRAGETVSPAGLESIRIALDVLFP